MNRRNIQIAAIIVVLVMIGAGIWLYKAVQGDTKAASGPITAVPLDLSAPSATDCRPGCWADPLPDRPGRVEGQFHAR